MIYEDALIVNKNTGEVMQDYNDVIYIQTKEEREQRKDYLNNQNKANKNSEIKFIPEKKYENQGAFIWNIHDNAQTLFPKIRHSSLTRLMYLATFLSYDGYLKDGRNPITKKMLMLYLNIKEREYYRFWSEMTTSKLMYEKDSRVYLNPNMFIKGSIRQDRIRDLADKKQYITRIYADAVRQLYHSATARSIKSLSYLFRILPYVNREYNICCFNPLEENLEDVQPMTLGDFADIVGYDRSSANKLARTLQSPTFNVESKHKNAMRYVVSTTTDAEAYGMFINPRVYYAGDDWDKVEVLCAF